MDSDECKQTVKFSAAFEAERKLALEERNSSRTGAGKTQPAQSKPPEDINGVPLPSTWPYPGLRAFTPREARLFFGRHKEAGELRKRLADSNVVVVLGGSGSGKSSLVLAGVLPRLNDTGRIPGRRGRWYTASFRPGDSPCNRLVEALWHDICLPLLSLNEGLQAFEEILCGGQVVDQNLHNRHAQLRERLGEITKPDGELTVAGINAFLLRLDYIDERITELREGSRSSKINVLLLIDQFEELFRDTVKNEKQKDIETIVELLQYAGDNRDGPLVVVVTLRSEELHRCTEIEGLAPVVNFGFYLIDRPGHVSLDLATVNPGRQTLLDWSIPIGADDRGDHEDENIAEQGPFSADFMKKLKRSIQRFQKDEFAAPSSGERRKRHQADLLPLFQHLLRISWTAAVERWARKEPDKATVETSDIEQWIEARSTRVAELRAWMRENSAATVPESPVPPDNLLERCFDTAFAITLSEAIAGKRWDELPTWPPSDEKMRHRLRLIQAAFVALATRDDKGNDARRPASAAEILAASCDEASEEELKDVLAPFKKRDYLQGGEMGERYDVSHEALIRNSTEYQAWLADAKNVTDALTRADLVLDAVRTDEVPPKAETSTAGPIDKIWQPLRNGIGKVLGAPRNVWAAYLLTDVRDAGTRFTESLSRQLARIFGAAAIFSPAWMAERAQLGKTAEEQSWATRNIETTWTKAYRWHVDIDTQRRDEKPYFGSGFIKAVRAIRPRPDSVSAPVTGRTLRAARAFALFNLFLAVFVILPLVSAVLVYGVRPMQQKARLFSAYAANNQTNDFRLKLLLLASTLRTSESWIGRVVLDASDLEQKAREVLLRSPVFGGTFASAAWNADGTRVITMKDKIKNSDLVVYNLLDEKNAQASKPTKPSPLPDSTYEPPIAPPPSIGFIKQEDGSETIAAFRIVSGSVWAGTEGSPLKEVSKLPDSARVAGQWIPRADIFDDHVRIIFLSFLNSAINAMNVLNLPRSDLALLADKQKEEIDWQPVVRQAFRQPVLAEECNAYAFFGKDNPANTSAAIKTDDTTPFYKFWLREPKQPIKEIRLEGLFSRGAVAISRGCKVAVARNDSQENKQELYLLPFGNSQKTPAPISLTSLSEEFANGSYPIGGQAQAELAAAPRGDNAWRVAWPTRVGLAVMDINAENNAYKAAPAVPAPDRMPTSDEEQASAQEQTPAEEQLPAEEPMPAREQMPKLKQKQMLTGLETAYEYGSLSLSPDGSRAFLLRQYSFASPVRVRAFNLDFEGQWEKLAKKGTDELIEEACRIATIQDGGNRLTVTELNTWFKDENAPQPCPQSKK